MQAAIFLLSRKSKVVSRKSTCQYGRQTGQKLLFLIFFSMPGLAWAQNMDIDILRSINHNRNKNLDGGMAQLTNSVYPVSAAIPLAELVQGYRKHDKKLIAAGWTTAAGLGTNFIIAFGMKYTINRTRPYVTYPDIQSWRVNIDPSFPSGHTSFAFNTATSLSTYFPKWYVIAPAFTWASCVGYSRMHLGMHYPSDVVVGAIVGAGTSLLAHEGNKWLQHRRKQKTQHEH